jgi:hypothetical protein
VRPTCHWHLKWDPHVSGTSILFTQKQCHIWFPSLSPLIPKKQLEIIRKGGKSAAKLWLWRPQVVAQVTNPTAVATSTPQQRIGIKTLEFYCKFVVDSRSDWLVDWWYPATGVLHHTLRQNTKAEMRINKERRRMERASPTLHHALKCNRRHIQIFIAHFTI